MYYIPEPPIGLLFFGFFIGVTCGLAFQATLKQQVMKWSKQGQEGIKADLSEMSILIVPFWGICVGICIFLAGGLEIFIYSRSISYVFAGTLTLLTAGLIWTQLKKLIVQLLEGGSRALDLDAFY
jgi:hypothetical protein